jgi:flagellar assembly factor FliW
MEVETKTKGRVSVTEKQIITVPDGLFGFEKYKKYALIDSDYTPFIWLQSLDESSLAFLIIDPFVICSDYEADIDDESLKKVGITLPEDIVVMAIVTVPADGTPVTANLQGPIVINRKNNQCMQVILSDSRWTTKYRIGA